MEIQKNHSGEVIVSDKPKPLMLVSLEKFLKQGNIRNLLHTTKIYLKRRIQDIPDGIIVEPINVCNIKCPVCSAPQDKLKRKRQELSYDNFKHIANEIKDYTQTILLSGACEPLLNKSIVDMVCYASQNGLHVTIDTNATVLTSELAERLIESGLDAIYLSLDGSSKESYENFRVGAKFEETVQNIANFCALKRQKKKSLPTVSLECIANRLNEKELWEIKRMARQLGADRFWVKSLAIPSHLHDENTCRDLAVRFLPTGPNVKNRYLRKRPVTCSFWARNTVILVDGTVAMCCMDLNGEHSFGNIYKEKFSDIWNSAKYRTYRKELIPYRKLAICSKCPG